ncbi:MAG TPA: TIGR03032 family protein, partial [Tepidisphaeraceae bacterium]|nr:TIGR03032 family protein [Tepidisphaeraceae bacterium]
SSLYQIWKLEDSLTDGEKYQGHDRLYIPRIGYTTGDVDAHDIAVESSGRLVFVNTMFSCLATLSERRSFVPLWKPTFISKFAPEDRCHLNGLATENGKAAYVTSCSFSDVADGWRDRRQDGGCVIDVRSGNVVCRGLSMPHSPRVHEGKLFMHNSGAGWMGTIDLSRGAFEPLVFCPGYLRGLAFHGGYAIAGLSKPRDRTFTGLTLDGELKKREAEPQCGLQIIDLKNGDVKHWVKVEGVVTELYDVAVLKGVIRPMALGFKTDEIQRTLSMDDAGKL